MKDPLLDFIRGQGGSGQQQEEEDELLRFIQQQPSVATAPEAPPANPFMGLATRVGGGRRSHTVSVGQSAPAPTPAPEPVPEPVPQAPPPRPVSQPAYNMLYPGIGEVEAEPQRPEPIERSLYGGLFMSALRGTGGHLGTSIGQTLQAVAGDPVGALSLVASPFDRRGRRGIRESFAKVPGPVRQATQGAWDAVDALGLRIEENVRKDLEDGIIRASTSVAEGGAWQPKNWRFWTERGGEAVSQMMMQVAGSMATGGAGGLARFAAFAAPVAMMEGGAAYRDAHDHVIESGGTEEEARAMGAGAFAVTAPVAAALERVPEKLILDRLPGIGRFTKKLWLQRLASTGAAAIGEGSTEVLQEYYASAVQDFFVGNPDAWDEIGDRAKAGFALGLLAGGIARGFTDTVQGQERTLIPREQEQFLKDRGYTPEQIQGFAQDAWELQQRVKAGEDRTRVHREILARRLDIPVEQLDAAMAEEAARIPEEAVEDAGVVREEPEQAEEVSPESPARPLGSPETATEAQTPVPIPPEATRGTEAIPEGQAYDPAALPDEVTAAIDAAYTTPSARDNMARGWWDAASGVKPRFKGRAYRAGHALYDDMLMERAVDRVPAAPTEATGVPEVATEPNRFVGVARPDALAEIRQEEEAGVGPARLEALYREFEEHFGSRPYEAPEPAVGPGAGFESAPVVATPEPVATPAAPTVTPPALAAPVVASKPRRAPDFKESGEYEVDIEGMTYRIYRDPESKTWYETPERSGAHFSDLRLGYTQQEAVARLTEMVQSGTLPATKARSAPPADVATPAAPTVTPPAPAAPAAPTLPRDLAGATPNYGYMGKNFGLDFQSDLDKALYIVAQKTPSKRDTDYMAWLRPHFAGDSDTAIRERGRNVRERIKQVARTRAEGGRISVEATAVPTPASAAALPTEAEAEALAREMWPKSGVTQIESRERFMRGYRDAVAGEKPRWPKANTPYHDGYTFYDVPRRRAERTAQLTALDGLEVLASEAEFTSDEDFQLVEHPVAAIVRDEVTGKEYEAPGHVEAYNALMRDLGYGESMAELDRWEVENGERPVTLGLYRTSEGRVIDGMEAKQLQANTGRAVTPGEGRLHSEAMRGRGVYNPFPANVELQSDADPAMARFSELPAETRGELVDVAMQEIVEPIVRSEGLPGVRLARGLGSWFSENRLSVADAVQINLPGNTKPEIVKSIMARISVAMKQAAYFTSRPSPVATGRWAAEIGFNRSMEPAEYGAILETISNGSVTFNGTTMMSLSPARVQITMDEGVTKEQAKAEVNRIRALYPDLITEQPQLYQAEVLYAERGGWDSDIRTGEKEGGWIGRPVKRMSASQPAPKPPSTPKAPAK
jgi:hypothetical protein